MCLRVARQLGLALVGKGTKSLEPCTPVLLLSGQNMANTLGLLDFRRLPETTGTAEVEQMVALEVLDDLLCLRWNHHRIVGIDRVVVEMVGESIEDNL
mgnify:CR=1 FL=1